MQIGEAKTYGNPGDSIVIKLKNGKTINAIAGNAINSSKVLVAGGYVWSATSPVEVLSRTDEIYQAKLAPVVVSTDSQIFLAGIWVYQEWAGIDAPQNYTKIEEFVTESWVYNENFHYCQNTEAGDGQYDTADECAIANATPTPDRPYSNVPPAIELLGRIRLRNNFYSYTASHAYMPRELSGPTFGGEKTYSNETLTEFIPSQHEAFIGLPYDLGDTQSFRIRARIRAYHPEGVWGENQNSPVARSYIHQPSETEERGRIEEYINGSWQTPTGFSCSLVEASDPAENYYECAKEFSITYSQGIDGYVYGLRVVLDEPTFAAPMYRDFYLKVDINLYRNVNVAYVHSRRKLHYYVSVHNPIDAKFRLTTSDLPLFKLFEVSDQRAMNYYFTFVGRRAYFIAYFGKQRNPDVSFQERVWVKARIITLDITAQAIAIASDNEYDFPAILAVNLDDWQKDWAYSFEPVERTSHAGELGSPVVSSVSNNCLEQIKHDLMERSEQDYFREYSTQTNQKIIYKIEGRLPQFD